MSFSISQLVAQSQSASGLELLSCSWQPFISEVHAPWPLSRDVWSMEGLCDDVLGRLKRSKRPKSCRLLMNNPPTGMVLHVNLDRLMYPYKSKYLVRR